MVFEEAISKALSETNLEQQQLLDKATAKYFSSLPTREFPSNGDLNAADTRLRLFLRKELLTSEMLTKITSQSSFDNKNVESLSFAFDTIVPSVTVPKPAQLMELRAASVALAALLGAILGLTLLTPLTRLTLGIQDVGIVLGGPLGAFCMVLIVWRVSRSSSLIKFLQVSLGVASVAEVWLTVRGYGILPRIWRMSGSRRSAKGILSTLKHIVLCIAIIFLLTFSKRRPEFDRSSQEQVVRSCIKSWLNMAIPLLVSLEQFSVRPDRNFTPEEEALVPLAGHIYALHSATKKDLPAAVDELIQEAKNLGFEGLEGQTQFFPKTEKREFSLMWASDLTDKYEAFGDIREGDKVKIERKPVIWRGRVLKRGLVRKFRDRD